MSIAELSRRLAVAVQGASIEDTDRIRDWYYRQSPVPTSLDEAPEDIQELVHRLEDEAPRGLALDGEVVSDTVQVLVSNDGFSDPKLILSGNIKDDTISLRLPDGETESYEIASGSIIKYQSGVVSFVDKNSATEYHVRPLDESDGYWLSSYQIALPLEALASLVSQTEEGLTVNYLENEGEEMIAHQIPGEDDIEIVHYTNKLGRWIRSNGEWILAAHDDDSINETRPYEVNKDTVQDFLQVFDSGPLSAGDVKKYLTPIKG